MTNVAAYQSDEATSTPILIYTETMLLEEIEPTSTPTEEEILFDPPTTVLITNTPTAILPAFATSTEAPPLPQLRGEYAPDQVLIQFKTSATDENILYCLSLRNAKILSSIEELGVQLAQIPFGTVAEAIASISTCPEVHYVEPNYTAFIADTVPSDPSWGLQYGLVNIRAPQGWDYSTGSSAVTIAILDSGVDLGHPDLAGKIVPGYDFVNNDSIPQDDNGHGTHVAGIAAASGNNGVGVAGVSWGARIMPIKVLNVSGGGSFANVANGIIWATDHGAQVINLSLGGATPSTVLQDAVNYAYDKGVVLVAASGNNGSAGILYPARYPNVIAVGAVDSANGHAGFSNFGPELDLVAPGVSIYSTFIGGYGYDNGTSMAAPYVSGLAAILRGYPGGYSPAGITLKLESTALDLGIAGPDNLYGFGLIQMDAAIQSVYVTPTSLSTLTHFPPASGNQSFFPPIGSVSTLMPLSTLTGIPSIQTTTTDTPAVTITLTDHFPAGEQTVTSEVNALSTPQSRQQGWFSAFAVPCLAGILILSGMWLFMIARHKKGLQRGRF